MKKLAIILLVIGEKQKIYFDKVKKQFEQYAKLCWADLIICDDYLDKTPNNNTVAMQKMLMPSKFINYDWILVMDIDILINKYSPSIFDFTEKDKYFYGNLSPVGTPYYNAVALYEWGRPDLIMECRNSFILQNKDFLEKNGFPVDRSVIGTINGGVWLAKTSEVAEMFEDYYYNYNYIYKGKKIHIPNKASEEIPISYLTQINGIFSNLDKKFNYQVGYPLHGSGKFDTKNSHWRSTIYNNIYYEWVREELKKCYFLHFGGGYKMPIIDYQDNEINEMIYDN